MANTLRRARVNGQSWLLLAAGASVLAFGVLASCSGDDSGSGSTATTGDTGGSAGEGGSDADGGSGGTSGSGGSGGSGGSTTGGGGSGASAGEAGASGAAGDAGGPATGTEVGPEGGTVTGPDGVELVIPPGALDDSVLFAITKDPSDAPEAPAGTNWVGSVYAITPHGIEFDAPVALHLPFDADLVPEELTPTPFKAEPGGAFAPVVGADVGAGTLEIAVADLSFFSVGIPFSFLGAMKPTDVAAYPGGGAVVVGFAEGGIRVVKVNESGAISWERVTQGTAIFTTAVPRVAVGPTGNVYVATSTSTDEDGVSLGQAGHLRITSYNPSGDVRSGWPVRVAIGSYSFPTDIVADGQDNVFFAGTTAPVDTAANDSYRPFLGAYREDATVLRAASVVNTGATEPQLRILSQSVAIGPNGSTYLNAQVVPFVYPEGAGTRLTAFDALGEVKEGYPLKISESTTSSQMVVDVTGICYVLESNDEMLHAINPNGSNVDGFPQPVELPTDGTYYVAGYSAAENAFAVSVTGNLYFVGDARDQPGNPGPEGNSDVYLQSLNTTGAQRSGFPVYLSTPEADIPAAVAVDDAGANAWVAWYTNTAPAHGFVTRVPAN